MYAIGILNIGPDEMLKTLNKISVVAKDQETIEEVENFYTFANIDRVILDEKLRQTYSDQEVSVKIGYAIVTPFVQIQSIVSGIEGIDFAYLTGRDVARHRLVREIIKAYEDYEGQNGNKMMVSVK